jgi:hypothetical protein
VTFSIFSHKADDLRVFENRVLRSTSGPIRDEIGAWRRLRYEELHNSHASPVVIRIISHVGGYA